MWLAVYTGRHKPLEAKAPPFPPKAQCSAWHSVGSEQALAETMNVQQEHIGQRHKTSPHVAFSNSQQALEAQAT